MQSACELSAALTSCYIEKKGVQDLKYHQIRQVQPLRRSQSFGSALAATRTSITAAIPLRDARIMADSSWLLRALMSAPHSMSAFTVEVAP